MSLCPSPMSFNFDNWNFDSIAGDAIANDDSWLSFNTGPITDGAAFAGVDPVLAPASSFNPEIRYDGGEPTLEQFLAVCSAAAAQENGGIVPTAINPSQQVQDHPLSTNTTTNTAPTNRIDIPLLVPNRRPSIPNQNIFANASAAPARRRSRAGSIATLNRQAQWSAQPKSPLHDLTFGRRASITHTQSRKRKLSVCDVPLRRTAVPRAEPPRRPQVPQHAPCHHAPSVTLAPNNGFPRLSLSLDLLGFNLPAPDPHFELPTVTPEPQPQHDLSTIVFPEFEHLPEEVQNAMINKSKNPPFVTCGWGGCRAQVPPNRPALRDHLNRAHGGRPSAPGDHEGSANSVQTECEWGRCSQWVQWGGMSRHLLSHICPGSGHCMLCGGSLGRADMVKRHIAGCWKRLGRESAVARLREIGMLERVLNAPPKPAGERPAKRARKA
ncbi:hypothetical protein PENSPDRAFT_755706 [Peniophora sp. CONT]|nr:hypothetical protein PENSPDRAFT_755706 [Peniophora sp. CONT]